MRVCRPNNMYWCYFLILLMISNYCRWPNFLLSVNRDFVRVAKRIRILPAKGNSRKATGGTAVWRLHWSRCKKPWIGGYIYVQFNIKKLVLCVFIMEKMVAIKLDFLWRTRSFFHLWRTTSFPSLNERTLISRFR